MKQIKWKPLRKGDRVRVMGFDIYGSDLTRITATVTDTEFWQTEGSVGIDVIIALTVVHRCQLRKFVKKPKKEPRRVYINSVELASALIDGDISAPAWKSTWDDPGLPGEWIEFIEVVKK
jgi:hypothetical protein